MIDTTAEPPNSNTPIHTVTHLQTVAHTYTGLYARGRGPGGYEDPPIPKNIPKRSILSA